MRITRGFRCQRHCVASTCSTSDEPMPKASAPSAPWVDVWESPQTSMMPGWVRPCSGPTTCTMPWRAIAGPEVRDAVLARVALERVDHRADLGIGDRRARGRAVGT